MIEVPMDDCRVCILPIVNGIVSEADRVREVFGGFEVYGLSIGFEGIEAIKKKMHLEREFEVNEIDLAYAHRMQELTGETVEIPSPAMCMLVDLCTEQDVPVISLDMNDAEFTDLYCETVKAWDFIKEHRLAKKGMKKRFTSATPEQFAKDWDDYINGVKGYRQVSEKREAYIANQIRDTARYRKSLLAVIEVERVNGVLKHLR